MQPESLWKAGASANGTVHWARTSLQGSFSFEQMEGKNVFTSMFLEPGYFPVDMMLRLNGGMGRWEETGLQGGAPDAESAPFRLTPDWMRKMEYLSTTKAGGGLTLKYRFKAVKGLYIQADGTYLHGFGIELLPGANRWSLTSRVGYNF